jgi:hypothetical protein
MSLSTIDIVVILDNEIRNINKKSQVDNQLHKLEYVLPLLAMQM